MYSTPDFSDTRYRTTKVDMSRRPHSTYPSTGDEPVFHLPRKYTDPTPHTAAPYEPPSPNPSSPSAQLDVDLDVYSQEYYDVEDDLRQPSLSIVTSSTIDSTTSSPSIPDTTYTYGTERFDRKQQLEPEPRAIRMRTNAGRQNAYSSAESSLASAAYSGQFSYHAYSDNLHAQPPVPDINLSSPVRSHPVMEPDHASGNSCTDASNSSATFSPGVYAQPWRSPVMNRARSHSETTTESTDDTTDSASGCDRLSQAFANSFGYLGESPGHWDQIVSEPTALALVDDGRSKILNVQQIEAMGGLPTLARMSENELLRLPRYTHLLLSAIGPEIMTVLPQLLDVLSTTLVVLDISDNNLGTLPTGLRHCSALEELNVSGNPLRALPPFLADCQQLRLFAADNCLLTTLPQELSTLQSLHTLCIRGNRMVVLPSWICLLTRLEALRIDNNPFAPQWRSIVAPILTSTLAQNSPYPTHSRTASAQSSVHSLSMGSVRSSHASVTNLVASSASSITNDSSLGIGYPSEPSTPSRSVTPAVGIDDTPTAGGPVQSLRTTRAAPRPPAMGPQQTNGSRAPNRSASHPQPSSEVFAPSERMSGSGPSRRVQSAVGPGGQPACTDDSEDGGGKHKWGFLRKVSISRLRTEKDYTAQLNAMAAANISSMPPLPHTHSAPNGVKPRRPTLTSGWSTSVVPTRTHNLTPGPATAESAPVSPANGLSATNLPHINTNNLAPSSYGGAAAMRRNKRRSFLPIDPSPPSLNGVSIPSLSPLMAPQATLVDHEGVHATGNADDNAMETLGEEHEGRGGAGSGNASVSAPSAAATHHDMEAAAMDQEARYARGLESIKSYLRDLYELSLPALEPYGGFEVVEGMMFNPTSPLSDHASLRDSTHSRPNMDSVARDSMRGQSMISVASERRSAAVDPADAPHSTQVKRFKDDKSKRAGVIREIYETEKTYVRGLQELIAIYVQPASQCISSKSNETLIPLAERKVVFGGVESILVIHRDNFLPALERVIEPLLRGSDDSEGTISARIAHQVGEVFRTYIAYMKQYSTYINNFDNALQRMRSWTLPVAGSPTTSTKVTPSGGIGVAAIGAGLIGSAVLPVGDAKPLQHSPLQPSQRKRVKHFLKKCKENPRHSQINLESYLLLPVQRVPRYKLLLEDLAMCTPPRESIGPSDALDDAINEIANLASLMNEEKREAESRLRLLHWQQRITSRGPSPLVQPHRKLVLDGALQLIRVVKKTSAFAEVDYSLPSGSGDNTITTSKSVIPIEFIKPEPMDKAVMLILCSDMLVLVQKRNDAGWDGPVDLFSVLRMATLKEPASILHSNDRVLRVVDNKSIYYFNAGSHSTALQWCRAINGQNRK